MTLSTLPIASFHQPAEWQPHQSCWLAWPSHEELWLENLPLAQAEFVELCRAIADLDPVTGAARGEQLEILVLDAAGRATASAALTGIPARFHFIPFGDIWLRDIAPIFLVHPEKGLAAARFDFNGWGNRYILPSDTAVATTIAQTLQLPEFYFPFVLEGGAIEVDGAGTCLTTRQCLMNPNRNPGMGQAELEHAIRSAFGVSTVLWLEEGLLNDHTDGHIDTIARFVMPGVVACMEAREEDDPNRRVMQQIAETLVSLTDAQGRRLQIVSVPSPGKILDEDGEIMPASYLNFYIGNRTVVVPTYGSAYDAEAVDKIAQCFPTRRTVGLSAKAILAGGGAFHCITQQQPYHPTTAIT